MRHSKGEFDILFERLKVGEHTFNFQVGDEFFADIEHTLVEKAKIDASLVLDKKENMMVGKLSLKGTISGSCDRCTDTLSVPVEEDYELVFKFSDEESNDENMIHIPSSEHAIKLKPTLYELISVLVPNRMIHPEGACNQQMLELIEKYSKDNESEEENIDPRWEALKKKNN